jgi:DNA-directed RNA polymerase specialized sigma subunit
MKRIASQQQNVVRTPERLRLLRSTIQKTNADLSDELGYEPSDGELAGRMRISVDRLRKARSAAMGTPESGLLAEANRTASPNPEASDLWLRLVYDDLNPRQQLIVDHWRQDVPAETTARTLRVTPAAISQQRAKIQALLDKEEALSPFLG